MDKKTITSKTILFVVIVVGIILFQQVFGAENTLIGVTIITAALMFMERDLTSNSFGYFLLFGVINIAQGLGAYYTSYNPIIGIFISFILLFVTGYIFTYSMRKPMYVAFGLQYLFMVFTPVTSQQLPMRLIALLFGAVFIMLMQIIANKNRLEKASKGILPCITEPLEKKIKLIIEGNYGGDYDEQILNSIVKLSNSVQENRQDAFHITVEGKVNFNLSIALERINILVDRISEEYKKDSNRGSTLYVDVMNCLGDIVGNLVIDRDRIDKVQEEVNRIDTFLQKYAVIYKSNGADTIVTKENMREILENLDFLKTTIEDVVNTDKKKYKRFVKRINVPKHYNISTILRRDFNHKSLKFSYAFRSALLMSIGIGIVGYFNLPEGKWLVFTLLAIIQPFKQDASTKSRRRIVGTLIGVIVFFIAFTLVSDMTMRSLMIMLAGYICSYQTDYSKQMIFTTFSALGAASLADGFSLELIISRLIYVVIGTGIAMIANKLILPYGVDDSTKYLMEIYNKIIDQIKKEISLADSGKGNIDIVRNLVMKVNILEGKVRNNLSIEDSESYQEHENIREILRKNRILINDLYDEYLGAYNRPKYSKI